jgi:hypothetical protein
VVIQLDGRGAQRLAMTISVFCLIHASIRLLCLLATTSRSGRMDAR